MVLVGEGEVGKTSLLAALRDEKFVKDRDTTHGIEIKPVDLVYGGIKITLNGWDFGGQKIYRPTHQLFFTEPAVYLVVWKPREGPELGLVEHWITMIRHRAGSGARIHVVATHGGPGHNAAKFRVPRGLFPQVKTSLEPPILAALAQGNGMRISMSPHYADTSET